MSFAGDMTGRDFVYLYPDKWTALVGEFFKGDLVSAKESRLKGITLDENGIAIPQTYELKGPSYNLEQVM